MTEDPTLPRPPRGASLDAVAKEDLELLSAEDLSARVTRLESEIGRTRQALERRRSGRSAADALFSFGR